MKLTSGNITLRPFTETDIEYKVRYINETHNNKFLHYDLPLTITGTKKWFQSLSGRTDRIDLTILSDDNVAGFIGLLSIDNKNKKAEYYICVDHGFAGRGIGKTASKLLIDYAFTELDLNKIYLYTEQDNIPAQKLFEKIGIKQEGLLKDDIIYNGRKINRYAYGICKEDYV